MSWDRLWTLLMAYQAENVWNQYRDVDPRLDRPDGAEIRRRNLQHYLETFADARYILVGEAAGYAGCRFSGIPFTCEAQLVGPERLPWVAVQGAVQGNDDGVLDRSSVRDKLWVEMSARIVWGALGTRRDCLLWNAFPWHPHRPGEPLTNRAPGRNLKDGLEVLRCLLDLFPDAEVCAVGRVAQRALAQVGVTARYIRHPSHGGKPRFVAGVEALPHR